MFVLLSCQKQEVQKSIDFDFFLNEQNMILNQQQNNSIEGNYLKITSISDSNVTVNLPVDFYLFNHQVSNWTMSWGNEVPYYDAGVENSRQIIRVDANSKQLVLGRLNKGKGWPKVGQNVVFWNTQTSGFIKSNQSLINTKLWPSFSGKSVQFGAIEFDSLLGEWVMLFNEYNSEKVQVYAATSKNLEDWKPYNNGNPILTAKDFAKTNWGGFSENGKNFQTPMINDVIRHNGIWYLLMDGYDKKGKQHIAILQSRQKITGPYTVPENPIVSPGVKGSWNDKSCFYAKIVKHNNEFLLFYAGWNNLDYAQIGRTSSLDLISWTKSIPVLSSFEGWRSSSKTTQPVYLESRSDSLFLMAMGTKSFGENFMGKSGNVDDAQLGVFLSTNKGKSFVAHSFNPIFVNDYTSKLENEHLGGNFKRIINDSAEYVFYHGKSSVGGWRYNVLSRKKVKK